MQGDLKYHVCIRCREVVPPLGGSVIGGSTIMICAVCQLYHIQVCCDLAYEIVIAATIQYFLQVS